MLNFGGVYTKQSCSRIAQVQFYPLNRIGCATLCVSFVCRFTFIVSPLLVQTPNSAQLWNNIGMCFFGKVKPKFFYLTISHDCTPLETKSVGV